MIDWYNCLLSSTYIVHLRSGLTRIHLSTRVIKYALMTFLGFWILVIRSPIFDIYDLARHLASGTHCAIERSTPHGLETPISTRNYGVRSSQMYLTTTLYQQQ